MTGRAKKNSFRAWIIFLMAAVFYFYEFMIQVSPGIMAKDLMAAFDITALSLGNLSAYYFYSYASMQLIIGLALDRLGPRIIITGSSIVCAIGCYFFGTASVIEQAEISRFVIGVGSACAVVSTFKIATEWFSKRMFGILAGITVTIGMLGAVFGEAPLAWFVVNYGWQSVMLGLGIGGLVVGAAVFSIVLDAPVKKKRKERFAKPLTESLKDILSCKQTWLTAIYGGLMFAPTTALGSLWGVTWMNSYYGFDRTYAAHIVSFLFIGWAVGSPLSGFLMNHFQKCKTTMYYGSLGALGVLCLMIFVKTWSPLTLMGFWFLLGLASSGFLPFMTIIKNTHQGYNAGAAMGFGNCLNMVGGALLQPVIGFVLDTLWKGNLENGVRVYSSESFMYGLLIIPVLVFISYLLLFFIKDNYHKVHEHSFEEESWVGNAAA